MGRKPDDCRSESVSSMPKVLDYSLCLDKRSNSAAFSNGSANCNRHTPDSGKSDKPLSRPAVKGTTPTV